MTSANKLASFSSYPFDIASPYNISNLAKDIMASNFCFCHFRLVVKLVSRIHME
jgi:hypothetical protein